MDGMYNTKIIWEENDMNSLKKMRRALALVLALAMALALAGCGQE